ncbi:hypothetical protein AB1Y20_002897 [Prymnesium parvum]|uniref:Cyclic nucleotide-binding domain-containing protein n=1 Tax=Prymnesium parvum TaxID=97485 RepID=A0AB34J9W5_PRYPA
MSVVHEPVERVQAGELIFSQGDHGDMLYILIEGRVSFHKTMKPRSTVVEHHGIIRKKRASMCVLRAGVRMSVTSNRAYGACGASGPMYEERDPAPAPKADVEFKVGECTPDCPRPMFGEISLWDQKPRQATARSVEPSKVLYLRHEHFQQFMNLLPDMEAMFAVGQAQYARWVYNSWSDSAGTGEGHRSVNSNAPILDTHPG